MSYQIHQNIKLEKFTDLDFAVYFELVKNIKVMQMITERALTLEEAHTEFAKILSKNAYNVALGNYKILDTQTNDFMGLAKLELDQPTATTAELGYMLLPEYWGKGIASQVVTFLIDHAKKQPYLKDLMAIIDPENIASRKILINNGFHSKVISAFTYLLSALWI
ncbi:Acetyltransferase (GNAT) family protein [compost metagenome]